MTPLVMSFAREYDRDRPSDSPLAMDVSASINLPPSLSKLRSKLATSRSWLVMGAYLVAGLTLGLILILGLGIGRGTDPATAQASANAVTDNIVRLHSKDIGASCWKGNENIGAARLTVALEVGIDGKIRYATASGATPEMRGCVETHVRSWEFLAQRQAQTMALPFEVDRH